ESEGIRCESPAGGYTRSLLAGRLRSVPGVRGRMKAISGAVAAALILAAVPGARAGGARNAAPGGEMLASRSLSAGELEIESARPREAETKKEQLARIFTKDVVDHLWMEDYDDLDAACT